MPRLNLPQLHVSCQVRQLPVLEPFILALYSSSPTRAALFCPIILRLPLFAQPVIPCYVEENFDYRSYQNQHAIMAYQHFAPSGTGHFAPFPGKQFHERRTRTIIPPGRKFLCDRAASPTIWPTMLWESPGSAVFHVLESSNDSAFQGRGPLTAYHQAGERDIDDLNSHFRHLGG